MARQNTPEEKETKDAMKAAWFAQGASPGGFDDWGKYTGHIVCVHQNEIERLRQMLESHGLDPGIWHDPFEV